MKSAEGSNLSVLETLCKAGLGLAGGDFATREDKAVCTGETMRCANWASGG